MGQLVIDMFVTLDGVAQAPGGPEEDPDESFTHGGWQAPYPDDLAGEMIGAHIERMDALLLGRKTYDIFAGYWPNISQDNPIARKLNTVRKYVASRTLTSADWNNSSVIQGDVTAEVARLKDVHDEVHTIGSTNLVQTLLAEGLADRLNLWLYPLVLGTGKRLFADGTVPTAFTLKASTTFPSGSVLLVYETAGKPTYGRVDAAS